LVVDHPKHLVALQRFSYLMLDLRAKPKVHVSYLREAWVSTQDNSIRVTMDRQVQGAAEFSASLGTETSRPVATFGQWTILELKFTGRFPNWFRDLVQTFGLLRCAAAKYADSVPLLGEDRLGCGSDLNGKRLSVGDRDVSAGGRRAQVFGSALADE
jgi:hypothetical protein